MKSIIVVFIASLCFISLSSFKTDTANTSEHSKSDNTNYAELTEIIFEQSASPEFHCTSSNKRIVIINLRGEYIREDCVENKNIFSSLTLTPLIRKSDLVMEIDNVSYYLLDSK